MSLMEWIKVNSSNIFNYWYTHPVLGSNGGKPNSSRGVRGMPFSSRKKGYSAELNTCKNTS